VAHLPPEWQDAKIMTARKFVDLPRRTHAEGGQVQPMLGGFMDLKDVQSLQAQF